MKYKNFHPPKTNNYLVLWKNHTVFDHYYKLNPIVQNLPIRLFKGQLTSMYQDKRSFTNQLFKSKMVTPKLLSQLNKTIRTHSYQLYNQNLLFPIGSLVYTSMNKSYLNDYIRSIVPNGLVIYLDPLLKSVRAFITSKDRYREEKELKRHTNPFYQTHKYILPNRVKNFIPITDLPIKYFSLEPDDSLVTNGYLVTDEDGLAEQRVLNGIPEASDLSIPQPHKLTLPVVNRWFTIYNVTKYQYHKKFTPDLPLNLSFNYLGHNTDILDSLHQIFDEFLYNDYNIAPEELLIKHKIVIDMPEYLSIRKTIENLDTRETR